MTSSASGSIGFGLDWRLGAPDGCQANQTEGQSRAVDHGGDAFAGGCGGLSITWTYAPSRTG